MKKSNKFIVGMVDCKTGKVTMFNSPTEHADLAKAEHSAHSMAVQHGKRFEVFKLVSAFGPAHPPIKKETYK